MFISRLESSLIFDVHNKDARKQCTCTSSCCHRKWQKSNQLPRMTGITSGENPGALCEKTKFQVKEPET